MLGCSQSGLRSEKTGSKSFVETVSWHDSHYFQTFARTNLQRLRSAMPNGSVAWLIARPAIQLCSFAQDAIQTKHHKGYQLIMFVLMPQANFHVFINRSCVSMCLLDSVLLCWRAAWDHKAFDALRSTSIFCRLAISCLQDSIAET